MALRRQLDDLARQKAEYEARFKGLQPVVQARTEELKTLKARLAELEQRLATQYISQLPEEQRAPALMAFQAQQTLAQQEEQRRAEQAVMEAILRDNVVTYLSQQYGVPREKLATFADPYAAEQYAQEVAALRREVEKARRTEQRQARLQAGVDKFEGAGLPAPAGKSPETMAEAGEVFAAALRQAFRR